MEVVKPAELDYLAIYNPSLGPTDETLHDQIVYYYSRKSSESQKSSRSSSDDQDREERNERLRRIGLAQGMIEFAKAFSDGAPVDAVDSEHSRILMHELEAGWWLLASINLTQIHNKSKSGSAKREPKEAEAKIEYSAREVGPQSLLLKLLLKAHSVFLLHHAPSLADLYVRLTKPRFCAALDRFWTSFIKDWDVLLHGTPAVDVFDGLKLAAGGELGIGVGEEEWGSGEREVLEGFVRRTEGLVDLVVARYGALEEEVEQGQAQQQGERDWLGAGSLFSAGDGIIFSGLHRVTRRSTMAAAKWIEWIYCKGQAAYGVQDNPHAPKRRRRRAKPSPDRSASGAAEHDGKLLDLKGTERDVPPGIPPPIVTAAQQSLESAVKQADKEKKAPSSSSISKENASGTDVLMKYMTFGLYGSGWGLSTSESQEPTATVKAREGNSLHKSSDQNAGVKHRVESRNKSLAERISQQRQLLREGCFLIGLKGDLDDEGETDEDSRSDSAGDQEMNAPKAWNSRILLRTLHVERRKVPPSESNETFGESTEESTTEFFDRVQVVVYVRQPFIFTFFFELQTPSLSYTSFYRSIHHQLGPLQRPLLRSTSPMGVLSRLYDTVSPRTVTPMDSKQPIYDLIYDPLNLTIHTTLPPIPEAGEVTLGPDGTILWSRLDALNVHSQIIFTFDATRRHVSELERTVKTSRGWWVVWIRLPSSQPNLCREAFLVRKATDHVDQTSRQTSLGFSTDLSAGWGSSAGKLAEGIGIDTRKYVEGLLNLNR